MLMPKRAKYRRVHRGRMTGKASRGNTLAMVISVFKPLNRAG